MSSASTWMPPMLNCTGPMCSLTLCSSAPSDFLDAAAELPSAFSGALALKASRILSCLSRKSCVSSLSTPTDAPSLIALSTTDSPPLLGSRHHSSYRAIALSACAGGSSPRAAASALAASSASLLGGVDPRDILMSSNQLLDTASASKLPPRTRILPHESQLEGTTILSRSMTLCFSGSRLRRDVMPRTEWMRVGSWEGVFWDV